LYSLFSKPLKNMNSNIKLFLLCPVPEDQKPINEYIGLKENPLTNWTTLSKKNYLGKVIRLSSIIYFLFSLLTFSESSFGLDWIISNIFWTTLCLIFFYFVLLWRWNQVKTRFNDSRLFYEEASWYDGQIWEKPFLLIKNDRLISTQKIDPILERLWSTLWFFIYVASSCFLLLEL